jgi:hypothetical protein
VALASERRIGKLILEATLTGNTIGFSASSNGVIKSYGDNYMDASNGVPSGSLTPFAKQ